MSTRRSVVHSEALSQLPESGLVIHQVLRADVTVLKLIWPFCGYRERRQVALRIQKKCNIVFQAVSPLSPLLCFGCFCVPGCVPPQPSALFWLFLCSKVCPPSAFCSVLAVFVFQAVSPLSLPAKLRFWRLPCQVTFLLVPPCSLLRFF